MLRSRKISPEHLGQLLSHTISPSSSLADELRGVDMSPRQRLGAPICKNRANEQAVPQLL